MMGGVGMADPGVVVLQGMPGGQQALHRARYGVSGGDLGPDQYQQGAARAAKKTGGHWQDNLHVCFHSVLTSVLIVKGRTA